MRVVLALLTVLLLTGYGSCQRRAERVPAQCNPLCLLPCTGDRGDTGVRWEADPADPSAWDDLAGETVVPQLTEKLRTCEVHRKACEQCLQRLDAEGVIDL